MSTSFRIEVGTQSGRVFHSKTYKDEADVVTVSAAIYDGGKAATSYVTLLDSTVVAIRTDLIEWVRAYKVAAGADDRDVAALSTSVLVVAEQRETKAVEAEAATKEDIAAP